MKAFLSIVSHNQSKLITTLESVSKLKDYFQIVIKSNTDTDDFHEIGKHKNVHWVNHTYGKGFSENNNINFDYCLKNLEMTGEDVFLIVNPDIIISNDSVNGLLELIDKHNVCLASINLYKDKNYEISDNSIRKFPNLFDFINSFVRKQNNTIIKKEEVDNPIYVDWAAGSFLAFKVSHYLSIGGFDEGYFMYCEDIDICLRSSRKGERLMYFPQISAIHLAKHQNRKVLSKHFYWHVSSIFRYILSKHNLINNRSKIK
ncbi:Glycosyl transferase, family 2 [Vibrio chagasii]|nr:Glycosyl transferase, family 2 [Vibrio chagasii]CAH6896347.1 Glycosyl transferase, family 2 [Vibrio chagasii]